ncbi:AfsR/SARP family transcriptional regulator [Streptomyces scopuliridis]|nr:BTAD domain-containing putative transcriptional regulator [Streptomyces scopuliridis]
MRFRILGHLEWLREGVSLPIGRRRERLLLGLLLLDIGRTVSANRLIELLWDEGPPPSSARGSLQAHVSRLRGRLNEESAEEYGFVLSKASGGYLLDGDPQAVDLHRFRSRLQSAERASAPAERLRLLGLALPEWGGPVLAGVASEGLSRRLGTGFDELRLSAAVQRAEARLALGQHGLALEELAHVMAEHPHHERLAVLRMIALYRSDRRGEALQVYNETRARLAEELGLDPGVDLKRVQGMILHADPALLKDLQLQGVGRRPGAEAGPEPPAARDTAARWKAVNPEAGAACAQSVRRHPRTGVYIGRERELEELTALAAQAGSRSGLVTVVGAAGTGKTALALQWSRRAEADFPDGQLFVDLRGHSEGDPLTPKEALTTLLSSLGTAYQDIPHREAELAELYQRALVGRRVLVVLDNAESADQVSGLVPYGLGCLALVTSRSRLGGLIVRHGASTLRLGPLATAEAEELLRSIIGAVRAGSEPQALADLVKVCGGNPLALRIVAANLAVNPDCRLADYAGALRSGNPLEHLSVAGDPGSAVRRAFELTRQRLDPETAEAFRMLGLLPGPATTVAAVAALLGRSVRATQALLDRLYSIHLVESIMRERVRLPDLIWWYARFLADEEQPAQVRREGRRRLLRWYLGAADAAARCLHPQFPRLELPGPGEPPPSPRFDNRKDAAAWFDAERTELVKLIQSIDADAGADSEPDPVDRLLASTLRGYFWLRRDTESWMAVDTIARRAAERAGDAPGQAVEAGEAAALSDLAGLSTDLGGLEQAAGDFDEAIALNNAIRRVNCQAQPLSGRGEVLYAMGRLREAGIFCRRALALSRRIGAPHSIARVGNTLAAISSDLGEQREAVKLAEESLQGYRAVGNLAGEAESLSGLALIAARGGDGRGALRFGLAASRVSRKAGRPRMKLDAMIAMGHARFELRSYERALAHFDRARPAAYEMGYLRGLVMALLGSGVCALRMNRPGEALRHSGEALALARSSLLLLHEGQAYVVKAMAHRADGDQAAARRAGQRALEIYARTGFRPVCSPFSWR